MKIINICNKVIEYSFYLLFFLVPLALTGDTSELFEFNKLWVTFILTIAIGAAWFTKMIVKKELKIQRTPLDIPIALFLVSEIISTVFSLDTHTSLWGYYSRFNGGLLSIFSYVFLYYAFVSNMIKSEHSDEESKAYNFPKGVLTFISALAVFILGILVSTALKSTTTEAGFPFQMLATLVTAIATLAIFMLASPEGKIKKSLFSISVSSLIVALWGIPSHFGYDPTCLLFRGTFDVSCWTTDFHPTVRMFSTMGQPDWLAAYLAILLPLITALYLNFVKDKTIFNRKQLFAKDSIISAGFFIFYVLVYAAFMFTQSRAAIIALWFSMFLLFAFYFWYYLKPKLSNKTKPSGLKVGAAIIIVSVVITFFSGLPGGFPFNQLQNLTWVGLSQRLFPAKPAATSANKPAAPAPSPAPFSTGEMGGTDSGIIRGYVWRGAIDIWEHYPIFGTGVETFAYAYYLYRPAGHNMTSEWQYLYNKAHNEFLNYLATTGTVGILTYLLMIGGFYYFGVRYLYRRRDKLGPQDLLIASLLSAYTVINITNFGGFSVVMVNIFFYLFPAFLFAWTGLLDFNRPYALSLSKGEAVHFGNGQKVVAAAVIIVGFYMVYTLVNYWNADRYYYYGHNYDLTGDYQKAYAFLKQAVDMRPSEPTFQDEFAYNNAILGAAIYSQAQTQKSANQQQDMQIGQQLMNTAVDLDNQVTSQHPNDVVFAKTKVRIYYTLAQLNPSFYPMALDAIKKAAVLAPTDPDISYNLGVLYGQNGDFNNAVSTLQNTIKLKPDYKSGAAYYALAIFYHQLALNSAGKMINPQYNQKAIDELNLMVKYFGPSQQTTDALKLWEKQ